MNHRLTLKHHLIAVGLVSALILLWVITEGTYYSIDTFMEWPSAALPYSRISI